MEKHHFILKPSYWKGEGKIVLNMVEEVLSFTTQWKISEPDSLGKILAIQQIQISGISDIMHNELTFYNFNKKNFAVDMENPNLGQIVGNGLIDDKLLAWEFRNNEMNFEGMETYVLQPDGSYQIHIEYVTADQFRTQIDGRIWEVNEVLEFKRPEKEDEDEQE
jgi:hypothetical protein